MINVNSKVEENYFQKIKDSIKKMFKAISALNTIWSFGVKVYKLLKCFNIYLSLFDVCLIAFTKIVKWALLIILFLG